DPPQHCAMAEPQGMGGLASRRTATLRGRVCRGLVACAAAEVLGNTLNRPGQARCLQACPPTSIGRMMSKTYPETIAVRSANRETVEWVKKLGVKNVAEFGIYKGHTSLELARAIPKGGSLDLFDFAPRVS